MENLKSIHFPIYFIFDYNLVTCLLFCVSGFHFYIPLTSTTVAACPMETFLLLSVLCPQLIASMNNELVNGKLFTEPGDPTPLTAGL